jgi:DNA-binding NarL/FixJ family response regulator
LRQYIRQGGFDNQMKPIKVVVADDDEFWLEGLQVLTYDNEDIEVVGATVVLKDVERMVLEHKPDVVVLDIAWPGDKSAGLRLITHLKTNYPVQIVAISAYPELVELAQAAGAFPLKKGFKLDQLVDTIWRASHGDNKVASLPDTGSDDSTITDRELEVLGKVTEGLTDRGIGQELSISEGTVKKHMSSILAKLGAKNRAEAAVIALRKQLL